ncbi:hypothetical protein [Daejeonia sp. YH14]|uniref:hypothetical protein n=1 Tax=Daejeonia sp. YH14 TaxID=3439042 RepID=UPI003F492D24
MKLFFFITILWVVFVPAQFSETLKPETSNVFAGSEAEYSEDIYDLETSGTTPGGLGDPTVCINHRFYVLFFAMIFLIAFFRVKFKFPAN